VVATDPRFHPSSPNLDFRILLFQPDTSKSSKKPIQDHQSFHYLVQQIQIEMKQTMVDHFGHFYHLSKFIDVDFAIAAPARLGP